MFSASQIFLSSSGRLARWVCALARLLVLVGLALPVLGQAADAEKRRLTFDTTPQGADLKAAVTQLPVLVRLHSGNFDFTKAAPDGSDLRFLAADGKTALNFHLEAFDPTNELGAAWVQVPKIAGNATSDALWMQWGDAKAAGGADAKATFDAGQVFVLHFAADGVVRDATGHLGDVGAPAGFKALAAGAIGAAGNFAAGSGLVMPATAALAVRAADGFTFSAWVRPAALADGGIFVLGDTIKGISVGLAAGTPSVTIGGTTLKASAPLKPGVWQHIAVTAVAGKASILVDGTEVANGAVTLADTVGDAVIGAGFAGDLDEVALANLARSSDYVRALSASQGAESLMLALAEEEGEESTSYMAILLGAVTIDGWVVIGILMVMFVISVWVMIAKSVSLRAVQKANLRFLGFFRAQTAALLDPANPQVASLATDRALQASSNYQLYKACLVEVKARLDTLERRGKPRVLSAAMLDAVRASLDATIVRSNQRFNSGIVLLTIAISGGPFLGLLGTVVGVMITFAAIAASGDVNVNSIAPGIAAALVATVAGLAVAIPALFGYNWLAIQIKNVASDTQVFADELLTLTAEQWTD